MLTSWLLISYLYVCMCGCLYVCMMYHNFLWTNPKSSSCFFLECGEYTIFRATGEKLSLHNIPCKFCISSNQGITKKAGPITGWHTGIDSLLTPGLHSIQKHCDMVHFLNLHDQHQIRHGFMTIRFCLPAVYSIQTTPSTFQLERLVHHLSGLHNKPCLTLLCHSLPVCLWHSTPPPKSAHLVSSSVLYPTLICVRHLSRTTVAMFRNINLFVIPRILLSKKFKNPSTLITSECESYGDN